MQGISQGITKTQNLLQLPGRKPSAADPAATATLLSLLRTHRASRDPQDLTVNALPHLAYVDFDGAVNPPLTPPALRTLAPLLPILSSVSSLDISETTIDTSGAQLLSRYLPHMARLREVCVLFLSAAICFVFRPFKSQTIFLLCCPQLLHPETLELLYEDAWFAVVL